MAIQSNIQVQSAANAAAQDPARAGSRREQPGKAAFRVGEIVRGTILDIPARGTAKVELPSGTVLAALSSENLRRYDNLLFSIQSLEPRLVLKVDAVPIKAGGEDTSAADVLRILGRKQSALNNEIVRYARDKMGVLDADTLVDIQRGVLDLRAADTAGMELRDIVHVLGRMRDLGIPLAPEYFARMKSLLLGTLNFARDFDSLHGQRENLPDAMRSVLDNIRASLLESFGQFRSLLEKFMLRSKTAQSAPGLYDYLQEFVQMAESGHSNRQLAQARNLAVSMLENLEGQQLYNIHARAREEALVFTLIFPFGDALHHAQVELYRAPDRKAAQGAPHTFNVVTHLSALGEVQAGGSVVGKSLGLTIVADSAENADYIRAHSATLHTMLHQAGYVLKYCTVRTSSESGQEPGPAEAPPAPRGFNIVV